MSFFEQLLEKLTDVYNKSPASAVSKIIRILSDELDEVNQTLETVEEWRDIDQAEGKTLDLIGQNVGQTRNNLTDEQLRLYIKTKIRANLSKGDIETINELARLILGKRFIGVREGWTLPSDYPIPPKEAQLLISVLADDVQKGIPFDEIERVKAGGIKVNWRLLVDKKGQIQSSYSTSEEDSRVYTKNERFQSSYTANFEDNRNVDSNAKLSEQYQTYEADYLFCGMEATSETTINAGEVL